MFSKSSWTTDKARRWMKKHDLKPIKKVDQKGEYLRYRLRQPNDRKFEYRTMTLSAKDGIKAVLEIPK